MESCIYYGNSNEFEFIIRIDYSNELFKIANGKLNMNVTWTETTKLRNVINIAMNSSLEKNTKTK